MPVWGSWGDKAMWIVKEEEGLEQDAPNPQGSVRSPEVSV